MLQEIITINLEMLWIKQGYEEIIKDKHLSQSLMVAVHHINLQYILTEVCMTSTLNSVTYF